LLCSRLLGSLVSRESIVDTLKSLTPAKFTYLKLYYCIVIRILVPICITGVRVLVMTAQCQLING